LKISLISTVFNEENNIASWCKSLRGQTDMPDEVIIVDGGSTDRTVEIIHAELEGVLNYSIIIDRSCNLASVPGPIARGRNIAISSARNKFIVATDAGCVMSPNFVYFMRRSFSAGADFVCGAYDLQSPNSYQSKLRSSFVPNFEKVQFPQEFLPSSRSIGFAKKLFDQAGGYPENTFAGEDTYFAAKLANFSKAPLLEKQALVYWESPKDRLELLRKCIAYGYGDGLLGLYPLKYVSRLALLLVPPVWFLFTVFKRRSLESWFIHYGLIKGYLKGLYVRLLG